MTDERVVLLGGTFRQRLEPMGIVCHAILLSPQHHACCHSVGHMTVELCAIVDHIYHLLINVLWQILVHFLAVEDVLAKILARSLNGSFNVERFFLECLSDNLKSQIVCHICIWLKDKWLLFTFVWFPAAKLYCFEKLQKPLSSFSF